jgi:hypothetical protein
MENTKKWPDHGRCPPVNKEADILDQLKCCEIYFHHIANNTSVAGNTAQFYDTVRVSICHCNWNWITRPNFLICFGDFCKIFLKTFYFSEPHLSCGARGIAVG